MKRNKIERFGKLVQVTRRAYLRWEDAYAQVIECRCAIGSQRSVLIEEFAEQIAIVRQGRYEMLLRELADVCDMSRDRAHYEIGCNWAPINLAFINGFERMQYRAAVRN